MKKITLSLYTAAATLALAASAPALSQNLTLEEIIVTATKRAEGLQEVPIAISVMSGQEINAKGLTKMEDLSTPTCPMCMSLKPVAGLTSLSAV